MDNLRDEILKEHSKANTERILAWIGTDSGRVRCLMDLFFGNEYRVIQRGSWLVGSIAEMYPSLIEPYLPLIIQRLADDGLHVAVKRNGLRLLQFVEIPEEWQGYVLDTCFSFLENPKEGNVVQVFAMSVIERLTKQYPELISEFKCIIERNLENKPSPAFRSRATKTLIRLRRA